MGKQIGIIFQMFIETSLVLEYREIEPYSIRSSEDGECLKVEGNATTTAMFQVVLSTASTTVARRILIIIIVCGCYSDK